MSNNRVLTGAKSYGRIPDVQPLPDLIEIQLQSYRHFIDVTLGELFDEISPIRSFNGNIELHLDSYRLEEPKHNPDECRDMDLTYATPLWVTVRFINRETGEIQKSEVFFGDFPAMTSGGTFIISGTERVIVSQLIRSPGVYFEIAEERTTGMILSQAKLIPDRGAWLEFETRKRGDLTVKVNRKRKIPVTILLRALAAVDDGQNPGLLTEGSDRELEELFSEVDTMPNRSYIEATMRLEPAWEPKGERAIAQEALVEFFQLMRPGDPPTLDNALEYLRSRFFDPRRYDLSQVGRYKLNYRLHLDTPLDVRVLTKADVVELVRHMIRINNGVAGPDDIDHLGNRRIRTVGELLRNQLRVGLLRMERVVRERMSIRDPEQMTPVSLINVRPFVAASREFFGSSQLSQFMEQINPLTELTNKRTLSALGPGGLNRRRAGFDVRDVHRSHYGRICPIETPEGPNIGLIGRLATYARINAYGFIETPYRRVKRRVPPVEEELAGRILTEDVVAPGDGQPVAEAGTKVDEELARAIAACGLSREIGVIPYVTDEVEYLSADEEEQYTIAQVNAEIDERGQFVDERVSARRGEGFFFEHRDRIDYMDVSPKQIVGVSASLIPFLEHDDANRALMGANQQRQAVPLLRPEAPTVRTGVEVAAALGSGQVVLAEAPGEVVSVTGRRVVVRETDGTERTYTLRKFNRSNQATCIDQHPIVDKGDHVEKGDVLGDSSSTDHGQLALGQNVLMAFLSWKGGNYEDAILVSEELVRRDRYTSIHIVKHEVQARDTKLGAEEITRDIPNVGEEALKDLDQDGIIRIGADVKPDDILVGKITPKGEKELTPEEKLLRAIFGEKAREVKDSSLRLPHGERGKVVDVKIFDRSDHPSLPTGVNQVVRVSIAQTRKLTEGDKMAGRHGNKGVISKVVPVEDMPFLADSTPVELILDPLGVPGRMNIGQILEAHLGWAADRMGFSAICPVFDGAREDEIAAELARAWLMDRASREVGQKAWDWLADIEYDLELVRDDEEARLLYLSHWLSEGECDNERLLHDRIYGRRSALEAWLRELGYEPQDLLVWEGDDRPRAGRDAADQKARDLCLKLWLEEHGQDTSGLPDSESLSAAAVSYSHKTGIPMPTTGKVILYDGETGEPFDQPVTVGVINMMKLLHLVEDKIHARSTGPYSLVTQQPLGGKAQMGGQRFGEMEVWALEAYGAAHTLQEMLTVKSDDVAGRVQTYEAIIKGEGIQEPSIPESFRVLVKELQSLGLSIQVIANNGEVLRFGKEDQEEKVPALGLDLRAPGFGWT